MLSSLSARLGNTLQHLAQPHQCNPLKLRALLPIHSTSRRAQLASANYVALKRRRLSSYSIELQVDRVALDATPDALESWLRAQRLDASVSGAFVQLPIVGARMPQRLVRFDALGVLKDVDALAAASRACVGAASQLHVPATALGVAMLLEYAGVTATRERGVHVAIVGKGPLCGSPLAALLSGPAVAASVTLCDVFTRRASSLCFGANALVAAVGGASNVITPDYVDANAGATVIDVGGSDVSPGAAANAREFVPRVGDLTVAALAANTLNAARLQRGELPLDFVQLARNAHLLPAEHELLPIEAALRAPPAPHDDDGQTEPWYRGSNHSGAERVELTLSGSAADLRAAHTVFAHLSQRPRTVVLHERASHDAAHSAELEQLCLVIARSTDIVCVVVQDDSVRALPLLSPLALTADYCLTGNQRVDVDALLRVPSALAVARARIGDVVMVRGVTLGNLARDGTAQYLPSLLGELRQPFGRARVAALQRKINFRLKHVHAQHSRQHFHLSHAEVSAER